MRTVSVGFDLIDLAGNRVPGTTSLLVADPAAFPTWGFVGNKANRWVVDTPLWGDRVPNVIEIDPDYSQLTSAITQLQSSKDSGAEITVRPGSMVGAKGSGSTATPSIHDVGSPGKRILVRPRDGFGTVDLGGARAYRVHGVTWAGFTAGSFRLDSCLDAGQAWVIGKLWWSTTAGNPDMTGLQVVDSGSVNGAVVADSDVSDCWPNGANIVNPLFWGLYLAPYWRQTGSQYHQDSIQFEPFSGAHVNGATLRDCAIFGSKNTALEINALNDAVIDHSYIMAQGYYPTRYPQPAGTDGGSSWALNGGGKGGTRPAMKLRNSTIVGGWTILANDGIDYPDTVSEVTNVITDTDRSAKYPGTYLVYPGLNDDNFEQLTGLARPLTPGVDFQLADIFA